MILSARILDEWDRCEKRYAFAQKYEPKLISPLGVLYAALEAALVASDPEQEAKDETMRQASQYDMILSDLNSFMTVRHIGFLAGIIAVALQERFGAFTRPILDGDDWETGLFEDASGRRHRIELVSHFDDDRLRACAHSWKVIGELAALEAPLTLTAVVIGPQRGGRRHSEWTKGLAHPVNRALRFAPRTKKKAGFSGTWEKVWRDQENIPTAKWLAQMKQDGVMENLIVSREIAYNRDDHRMVQAREDMIEIRDRMRYARADSPMRRSNCDEFGGCPFQACCYSPTPKRPLNFPHLYRIRDTPRAESAECTSGRRSA
jgi:hypothetical protein